MLDDNWDLINGPAAHQIEVLNYSSQINVLEALVHFLVHHYGGGGAGCPASPNAESLKEIHRSGTLFLLRKPGEFRKEPVHLQKADGTIVYNPPPWEEVEQHVDQFVKDLGGMWGKTSPVQIAAFCLWKINWIHPFKNGNGRCARAFMYACLCLKYGFMLPGSPTVIDLISANKTPFEEALQAADDAFAKSGKADCSKLETYIEGLLVQQLSSVPASQ